MIPSTKPHIYLIDSNVDLLESISAFLLDQGYTVSASNSYYDFLNEYNNDELSCMVMDINTPDIGGLGLQAELINRKIIIPIIFMSEQLLLDDVSVGIKSGAIDFIKKPIDVGILIRTIDESIQKNLDLIECHKDYDTIKKLFEKITVREKEVLDLLSYGYSHKKIAKLLDISYRTVETHLQHIKLKTDIDLSDLVVRNIKNSIYLKLNPWFE